MSFTQHNTMESLLERGEKIDDLVSKSEVLGVHSKAFYKTVGAAGRGRAPLPASGPRAVTGSPHDLRLPRNVQGVKAKGPWLVHGGAAGARAGGSLSLPLPLPHGRAEALAWPHPLAPALCRDTALLRVLTALACGSFALAIVTARQWHGAGTRSIHTPSPWREVASGAGVSEQDPRLSGNSVFSGTACGDVAGNRRASPARCPCLSARLPPQQGSGGTRAGCVSPRVPVPLPLRALVPRAPSAVRAALRSGYRSLCRLLLSSSLSFSRPGNKTHAVQSCDRSQQRSLHGSHRHSIRTAAPGGEGGRAAWQSGQTRLPLRLEERRAGGRDPGWGSFKFTCLVSEKKV